MISLTVFAVVLGVFVTSSFALQCYDCMYLHETDCQRDGYKNKFEDCGELTSIEEIAGIEIVCVKLVYTGFRSNIVLRSCTRQGGSVNPCLALKCYNCDSQYNSDCSDDGYNKQMRECEELGPTEKFLNVEAVCLKEVTNGESGKRTLRKCFALHCYNCDTKTDASCADDGYKENSMKCPESNSTDKFSAPTPVCLKEVTTENGIKSTVRSCTVESRVALECYNCDSIHEDDCADEGYNKETKECQVPGTARKKLYGIYPVCLKQITVERGERRTTRGCSTNGGSIHACTTIFGTVSEYCSLCCSQLQCYNCASSIDPQCNEDGIDITTCPDMELLGGKIVCQTIKGENPINTIRSCGIKGGILDTCSLITHLDVFKCNTCETNLCNGSNKVLSFWLIAAVNIILIIVILSILIVEFRVKFSFTNLVSH
ncbi:unnamed protein product [Diamesa tonsa]